MNAASKTENEEIFARILKKLGERGTFFDLVAQLSTPGSEEKVELVQSVLAHPEQAALFQNLLTHPDQVALFQNLLAHAGHATLFQAVLTQAGYVNLRNKLVERQFFLLAAQLADLDHQHEAAGKPVETRPSNLVKRLLDDAGLSPLLARVVEKDDLGDMLVSLGGNDDLKGQVRRLALEPDDNLTKAFIFLAADGEVARFLADANVQQIVKKMANNGLYQAAEKLNQEPILTNRINDDTPFFATLPLLAKHPEMDGLLAAILTQLANDDKLYALPDDDAFARLVIDLATCQAVMDPSRRDEFFELVRGFSMEPESQALAHKTLFTAGFPQIASSLSQDDELTELVRLMMVDDKYKKVADKLKDGDHSAQDILSVAADPDFAETIRRMRDDKEHPDGFNPLVKMLVTEDEFFQQIKRLSNDEILSGIHDALTDRPLNATILAERLCDLADKLVINVDPKTDPKDKVKEKYEEIITTYQIAMRLDPGLKRAYHGYAEACLEMGYYAQCIEAYQTLLKKNSEATDVLLDLGFAYLRMNHLKEASECFRKVLDLSTDPIERRRANEGLNDIARRGG